jgi:hypothetical protein
MRSLQQALAALFQAAPSPITRAVHVERAFTLDHQTGWQVYQIATADNPLAATIHVPAPAAMRRLLKSAARRRVPAPIVARVSDAFDAFDALVQEHALDRAEFEAMVRALLPDERQKQHLAAKQSVFKGTSQLRGVAIDSFLQARFLYPSADSKNIDCLSFSAEIGLRRLNPGAKIGFGIMPLSADAFRPKSLDGRESDGPQSLLLPEFCSQPLPQFETVEIDGTLHYWIMGNDMGLRSALDLATAYRAEARWPRTRAPGGKQHLGVHEVIDVPCARLVFDVFVHQSLFNDTAPELAVYQTIAHGAVRTIGDPTREDDRLHLGDAIHPITGGLAGAALGQSPNYVSMLEHVCAHSGFRPQLFRGYRVETAYPFYGAQYSIRFKLPDPPATP